MRNEFQNEHLKRTVAEKALAVAEAKLAATGLRCDDFNQRAIDAERTITQLREAASLANEEAKDQAKALAITHSALVQAQTELETAHRDLNQLRHAAEAAKHDARKAAEQTAALPAQNKPAVTPKTKKATSP